MIAYMHSLTGFVTDVEFSLQDDLHLVVRVSVDERSALFKSVNPAADWVLRVDTLAACNVAEVGIFIGNQGRLELGLNFGEVSECWRGAGGDPLIRHC